MQISKEKVVKKPKKRVYIGNKKEDEARDSIIPEKKSA